MYCLNASDLLARLSSELTDPPFSASVIDLIDLWQVECLRIECALPFGLEHHPELSVRVRGAFGRQLHAMPQQHTRTGLLRPAAWDVLAAPLARLPEGDEVPKPVVLRADVEGRAVIVEMRVLGRAAAWFDEGASALIAALEGGIALHAVSSLRMPLEITNVFEQRLTTAHPGASVTTASLRFRSPVLARHKRHFVADPRAILRGIVRRIAGLAPWQATRLQVDWRRIWSSIDAIEVDDRDLVAYRWARHSIRQKNSPIPASGLIGTLRIQGQLAEIAPYLVLGESMNAGAQAALGHGWYDLALA